MKSFDRQPKCLCVELMIHGYKIVVLLIFEIKSILQQVAMGFAFECNLIGFVIMPWIDQLHESNWGFTPVGTVPVIDIIQLCG